MKAVQIHQYGDAQQLVLNELPQPQPGPGQLLIRVGAASVNPFDIKVRMGWLKNFYPVALPHTLGTDFAGEVLATGAGVSGFVQGQRVFGMLTPMHGGTYCDHLVVDAAQVRAAPAGFSAVDAAALPLVGVTALIAVQDLAQVQPGHKVLVHGGGGGVGGMAVMLAKHFGATVYATCGTDKVALVKSLGADHVIDYRSTDFCKVVSDADAVIDVIGSEVNRRSYEVLRRGGTLVVVLRYDPIEMAHRQALSEQHGVTVKEVAYDLNPEKLDTLRELAQAGAIRGNVQRVFAIDQAREAQALVESGHAAGKVVLQMA